MTPYKHRSSLSEGWKIDPVERARRTAAVGDRIRREYAQLAFFGSGGWYSLWAQLAIKCQLRTGGIRLWGGERRN